MRQLNFEWYVLNGIDFFSRDSKECRIQPYNIFDNSFVNESANKLCVKYKKLKMNFDDFVEELDKIIRWEECGRCEYEICVADWPTVYRNKDNEIINVYYGQEHEPIDSVDMWKIDCYEQAHANIRIIAKYILEEYYPRLKINLNTEEIKDN